jgi:hypothetical protein
MSSAEAYYLTFKQNYQPICDFNKEDKLNQIINRFRYYIFISLYILSLMLGFWGFGVLGFWV